MSWAWFAVLDPAVAADAAAAAWALAQAPAMTTGGEAAGVLAAWPAGRKPVRHALRIDAHAIDPEGPAGTVSLVVVPPGREPLFDDPAVSQAMRRVLSDPPADAFTTFVRDSSHFCGSLTVRRRDPWALRDDPFARLGPRRILEVGPGLLPAIGRVPALGPVVQRYAGQPWPAARFDV
jgi:hypothetical protein